MAKAPVIYTADQSGALGKKLDELLKKPKGMVLEDLLSQHRPQIVAALRVGYTYADLVATLAEESITVTEFKLKQFLKDSEPPNERAKSKKAKASLPVIEPDANGKSPAISPENPPAIEAVVVEPEPLQDKSPEPVDEPEPIASFPEDAISASEPAPSSAKRPRRNKPATAEKDGPGKKSTKSKPVATPTSGQSKQSKAAPSSQPKQLNHALQPQFQGKTLAQAIEEVLAKATEPLTAKDVAIELY